MIKKILKKALAVILMAVLALSGCKDVTLTTEEKVNNLLYSKRTLQFDDNGNFKVLIIADVHANGTLPSNVKTNIETLVNRENPNLVIFTGDNTICNSTISLKKALNSMTQLIEQKGISWCHVYGNHDHEGGLSKSQMQSVYESYNHCVSKSGDSNVSGVGNYVLPIYKNGETSPSALVWCLDSGNYISESDKQKPEYNASFEGHTYSPYDYIKSDQIKWYKESSSLLENYFHKKINSLMAFHIPLQETYYAWVERDNYEWTGVRNEVVGASGINSGLFSVLKERGDVKAVVNGHDHINDYMVNYQGIKLCYSPNVSTLTYHDESVMGARVFNINESGEITTYVSYLFK
ncbi:MAG: metallophosphoesterase [Clostridia bacterium]|nr:metallophosphoesterase [Clostridia bacterium]